MPREGATLRQLATLPRNSPFMPSAFHVRSSSLHIDTHSSPRHIITVETISSGAQHDCPRRVAARENRAYTGG